MRYFLYKSLQAEEQLHNYRYIFNISSAFYEYTYRLVGVSKLQFASFLYGECMETLRGTTRDSTRIASRLYGKNETPLENRILELDAIKYRTVFK